MITIRVKNQTLFASLQFPTAEPYFPSAPPTISLQSMFKPPKEQYNSICSCHPQLLDHKWNICVDLVQIVKDMVAVANVSIIESYDEEDSVYKQISNVFKHFAIDISQLLPDNEFDTLPSFGIIHTREDNDSLKNTGTGYSR